MAVLPPAPQRTVALTTGLHQRMQLTNAATRLHSRRAGGLKAGPAREFETRATRDYYCGPTNEDRGYQALHCTRRFRVFRRRRTAMLEVKTLCVTAATGSLVLALISAGPSAQQPPPPVAPILQNYKPVTAERLKKPEDGDWLMIRRTYDGWGYSPLDADHPDNVERLQPVWVFSTGVANGHEAPPMVNNGVMFVATPGNQVIAIDAKTGNPAVALPKAAPARRDRAPPDQPRRRALRRQSILRGRRSRARRARREDRRRSLGAPSRGEQERLLHLAGAAGRRRQSDGRRVRRRIRNSRFRRRLRSRHRQGALADLHRSRSRRTRQRDLAEGRPVEDRRRLRCGSRAITIPKPTWRSGAPATAVPGWATSVRATISTPRRRSPSTWRRARSRGTISTIPNDSWDWDEVSPPILVDYQRNGRTIKGLIDVARDGYLWFLERTDGKINFIEGKPYVSQNVFKSLDPKTGRPDVDPATQARHRQEGRFLPVAVGREELAPDRVQPQDANDLHSGEQQICA